jgi:hypothetical protein
MKKTIHYFSFLICGLALPIALLGQAKVFNGASATDNLFSNSGNWEEGVVPADSNINFVLGSTTAVNPAIVDPLWTSTGQTSRIYSGMGDGSGDRSAHVRVISGGKLQPTALEVGRTDGTLDSLPGYMHIETGGTVTFAARNAGLMQIGNGLSAGVITVDPGATFEFGKLILGSNGRIDYNFGTDSVTPFVNVQSGSPDDYALNGVISVNLANLVDLGTYTLMESSLSTITGGFADWLGALPGNQFSSSGNGTFGGGLFEVANGAGFDSWSLAMTNGGKNLEFTVIPEPRAYAAIAGLVVIGVVFLRRRMR